MGARRCTQRQSRNATGRSQPKSRSWATDTPTAPLVFFSHRFTVLLTCSESSEFHLCAWSQWWNKLYVLPSCWYHLRWLLSDDRSVWWHMIRWNKLKWWWYHFALWRLQNIFFRNLLTQFPVPWLHFDRPGASWSEHPHTLSKWRGILRFPREAGTHFLCLMPSKYSPQISE